MEQRLLLLCKEKISKIIKILSEQHSDEVTEFQTTVQMVQVVVNRLLNGKKQINIDVPLLDRINVILGEYLDILEQFVQAGRIKRLLQSNRIRRRLDKINSNLHAQLKLFVDSLKKLNSTEGSGGVDVPAVPSKETSKKAKKSEKDKGKKSKEPKKGSRKKITKKTKETKEKKPKESKPKEPVVVTIKHVDAVKVPEKPASPHSAKPEDNSKQDGGNSRLYGSFPRSDDPKGEKEVGGNHDNHNDQSAGGEDKLDIIKDVEGKAMWAKLFGEENFYVDWDIFLSHLSEVLKTEISPDDATLLKHVLDNSGTGNVNMYKWSEFLKGFGPLPSVIQNVRETLFSPWFHGFLSSKEAELLLEDQPVGTFLIRFSRSSGGSFALAFVQEPRVILHILIQSNMPEGYRIEEEEDSQAKVFHSLKEIVQHYSMHLVSPFTSDLPRESWFHGDVSAQEAQELLTGEKEGTFLIRFSSRSGCFAASYVGEGEIKHALIQAVEGGYLFAGEKEVFVDLKALLNAYASTLKIPLPNVENNVAPVLRRYWATKGLDKKNEPVHLSKDSHYESMHSVNKGK